MRSRTLALIALFGVAASAYAGGAKETTTSFLIDVARLEAVMRSSEVIVLDIRDSSSYVQGHIPGAILVALNEVEKVGAELIALGRPIITYCSCPAEESSLSAAFKLRELGAGTVYVLQGGYPAWVRKNKPIVTGQRPS